MKKFYEKPKVEKVKLVAEEAVLTNCKTDVRGGPGLNICINATAVCAQPGS